MWGEQLNWNDLFHIFSGVFGSGLCVLSKYPIVTTLFHAWSVNGYVHRIQHGDWFGGKGVGLCQILVNGYPVNVYIAHVRIFSSSLLIPQSSQISSLASVVACWIRSREWWLQCASCSAGIWHSTIHPIDAWRFGFASVSRWFEHRTGWFSVQVNSLRIPFLAFG